MASPLRERMIQETDKLVEGSFEVDVIFPERVIRIDKKVLSHSDSFPRASNPWPFVRAIL